MEAGVQDQLIFKNRTAFHEWLAENYARKEGLWLVFGKSNAVETLTSEEALEEALYFGWIDGLINSVDETRYLKFFSPRRPKSKWSEKNKATVDKLIQSGQMAAPGLEAIGRAKKDGAWDQPQRLIVTQEDIESFGRLITSNPKASANFQKMPPSTKKQFTGFYLDAKLEETRRCCLEKIIGLIEQNKKPM
jgi:uncharacterized protein YdeI (YjbR/CyaY-like superfamily)